MIYIKKLGVHGFKSFAKPTDIHFDKGMNVIVGPNGSGKSNVIDAICFVLGRLSAKSMRASKSSHLIYNGGKTDKPAQSAKVSLVFDNSDRLMSLDAPEVEISRFVKRDGSSIYKINNETKTRQEVLELLAQGGIDPEGFNIILQAQIDTIIKMRPEEKRQVIEEIAGISIYEDRKEKSLHELEKTDSKLKEITTILRERSAFLNNLERERKQALKHEHLKKQVVRCKSSILTKKIEDKKKENKKIDLDILEKQKNLEKTSKNVLESKDQIEKNNEKIKKIESAIEKETGIEQDKLRAMVLELRTELAGLEIKKENFKDQIESSIRKEEGNSAEKIRIEQEIKELGEKSRVEVSKNEKEKYEFISKEIENLKKQLQEIELKQKFYDVKRSEIENKKTLLEEKEKEIGKLRKVLLELENELSSFELKEIDEEGIKTRKVKHQQLFEETKVKLSEIEREILRLVTKKEIQKTDVEEILSLEQCPKCKQKVTKDYKEKLIKGVWEAIKNIEKELEDKEKNKKYIEKEIEKVAKVIEEFVSKEKEIAEFYERKRILEFKKQQIDKEQVKVNEFEKECESLKEDIESIKKELPDKERLARKHLEYSSNLEKLKEDFLKVKLKQPVQLYLERDVETELTLKKREIEQCIRNIKQAQQDKMELDSKLKEIIKRVEQADKQLNVKQEDQELIEKKFKKMISEKQDLQEENHNIGLKINGFQVQGNLIEQEINGFKIDKARVNAELSSVDQEFKEYGEVELIKDSVEELSRKLKSYEDQLIELGNVNLRALEVYDNVKKEYEEIESKVKILEEEKGGILKVISEIDKKKKQSFMQTFNAVNKYFSENFSSLSNKGLAFLDLENQDDPFAAGVNMTIKLGRGKYMDSNSLSGGEKVIIALSLIFAIQKYRPYNFYIFDEIDAALDKRNSEKLSGLIGKDSRSQYIVITHNDIMISNAQTIHGVSMQEGVTKIVGLKI